MKLIKETITIRINTIEIQGSLPLSQEIRTFDSNWGSAVEDFSQSYSKIVHEFSWCKRFNPKIVSKLAAMQ